MIENYLKFPILLKNSKIQFDKVGLIEIIQEYSFFQIVENNILNEEEKQIIEQNIKKSPIIIISQAQRYVQIGFEKTIILLEESISSSFLRNLFSANPKKKIYLLPNTKFHIENIIDNQSHHIIDSDQQFNQEITEILRQCHIKQEQNIIQIWKLVSPCILGYLIKKSYLECEQYRIKRFINEIEDDSAPEIIKYNEYFKLRTIGNGSGTSCILIYHIKKGKLCVIKKTAELDFESKKLNEREATNYSKIKHPLLPKYYGRIEQKMYIVIEYIKGQSIDNIDKFQLEFDEIIKIIFELMMTIKYFHDKGMIYRDLKPNNIMIDENKTIVLIDFDRLIENDTTFEHTLDVNNIQYLAPEINQTYKFTYKSDIYSLGKVIEFIMNQKEKEINQKIATDQFKNAIIEDIIGKCTDLIPTNRPTITELILFFCRKFRSKAQIELSSFTYQDHYIYFESITKSNKNDPETQYMLGKFYYENIYVPKDFKKAFHYYYLAAHQNYSRAQFKLGCFYFEGVFVPCDIYKAIFYLQNAADQNDADAQCALGYLYYEQLELNKAIQYYSLAADQNHSIAQLNLGMIFYEGKYITRNINKAIYYFSHAADQNEVKAQFYLGFIYDEGKYVTCDINKAIHYYELAANQNFPEALFNIGFIYEEGQYVKRDINKAIHYYELAANQNFPEAQFKLALINHDKKYITMNIKEAIRRYELAADQNDPEAQFNLGTIYYEGQYVTSNFNKAIFYYELAADQNYVRAQFILGFIYLRGLYTERNINKAFHYLSLAAKQKFSTAQYFLGILYHDKQFGMHDINKAIHYYELSALQNLPEAQFKLGLIYSDDHYVTRNINKAIHYFSLASNQNYSRAQFCLGVIHFEGTYIIRNIHKGIHYLLQAAKKNCPEALDYLGYIYYKGKHVTRDINRAIFYFSQAANQNFPHALYNLAIIYYEGKYVSYDINKAIHYFTLSANQNYSRAQFYLGLIYYDKFSYIYDINKAIHFFTLAANQNFSFAQLYLGKIYYIDEKFPKDIKKGILYLMLASKNGNRLANFIHGFLLHEGKNVKRDIDGAIHYYKEASSFNIKYAKNNLGILFKHGFCNQLEKKLSISIEYFNEAIRQTNDFLSMYNLAHIFIYEESNERDINKSIELLIKSYQFYHSMVLLSILLVKQFGYDINKIKQEIDKRTNKNNYKLMMIIAQMIDEFELFNESKLCNLYISYKNIDFLYNACLIPIPSSDLQYIYIKEIKYSKAKNISSTFYEGFGSDLLENLTNNYSNNINIKKSNKQ